MSSPRLMAAEKAQAERIREAAANRATLIAVAPGAAPRTADAFAVRSGRLRNPSEMARYAKGKADTAWARATAQKVRARDGP